jgi:hypothetical protein
MVARVGRFSTCDAARCNIFCVAPVFFFDHHVLCSSLFTQAVPTQTHTYILVEFLSLFHIYRLIGDLIDDFWLKPHNTRAEGCNGFLHCSIITSEGAAALLNFMWPIRHGERIDVYMGQNFDKFRAYFYTGSLIEKRQMPLERYPPEPPSKKPCLRTSTPWQWQQLTINPANKKEKLFWDIVGCQDLFKGLEPVMEELQGRGAVIVVGNGPISDTSLGAHIDDSAAAVVRCNNFRCATTEASHGARCNVQLINCESTLTKRGQSDVVLGWIAPRAKVIMVERIAHRTNIEALLREGLRQGHVIAELSEEAREVVMKTDATRGFLAIALATHAMVKVGGTIDIYGFGGSGHQTNVDQNIGHKVDREWRLWAKLNKTVPWFKWKS